MTSTTPSLAQMKVRSNSGHRNALAALAAGRPVLGPTASPGQYRGAKIVLATLVRWGCVDADGITETGRQLLEVLS